MVTMEPSKSGGIMLRPAKGIISRGRCVMCRSQPAITLLNVDTTTPCTTTAEVVDTIPPYARRGDVVEMIPKARAWKLCGDCSAAIQREVARAGNDAPRGLYIALAVVASRRSPPARFPIWTVRYWQDADARTQEGWMIRLILFCFLSPAISLVGFIIFRAVFH